MKKVAALASAFVWSIAAASPVMAKDGFYMGLAGIYVNGDAAASHSVAPAVGVGWFNGANRTNINGAPIDDLSTDAWGAGIFAGYRMDIDSEFFAAIEADANVFDGETENVFTQSFAVVSDGAFTINQRISQAWTSTIRGRLGVDFGGASLYATAGAAFTDVETAIGYVDTYPNPSRIGTIAGQVQTGLVSETKTGWVWGGGVDLGLGGSTKLRFEYLRHDFGDLKSASRALLFTPPAPALPNPTGGPEILSNSVSLENETLKIGFVWDLNL